jgi:alcohol dehydrogenase
MHTMQAARLHEYGQPFRIEPVPKPSPRPTDVVVRVHACGVVPNLRNVVGNYSKKHPTLPQRPLPAIYGLDALGVVSDVGNLVTSIKAGDRVYVNPALSCGSCDACRRNQPMHCPEFALHGYFGFGPNSHKLLEAYPYGGFSEYLTAPAGNLVKLSPGITDAEGARFGYLGTAYSALLKTRFAPGQTVLIDGVTGTLGVGVALIALAMGAAKVFGTGRNPELLASVKRFDPRVETLRIGSGPLHETVLAATGGHGVDALVSAVGPGTPAATFLDALQALRRGGTAVGCGALAETIPLDPLLMMRRELTYRGSIWFTTGQAQDLEAMVASRTINTSVFEHTTYPLAKLNDAIDAVENRHGGLTNIVVAP